MNGLWPIHGCLQMRSSLCSSGEMCGVCTGMGIAVYALATAVFSVGEGGGMYTWVESGGLGAQERYLLLVAGLVASRTKTAAWLFCPGYIASRNQKRMLMHLITLYRPILNRTLRIVCWFMAGQPPHSRGF